MRICQYHARRRFEIVTADVAEKSLRAKDCSYEALVVSDMFMRFVVVVLTAYESAKRIAKAFLDKRELLLGRPEYFLSDQGPSFSGDVISHSGTLVGTR